MFRVGGVKMPKNDSDETELGSGSIQVLQEAITNITQKTTLLNKRKNWHSYFLDIAEQVSVRSTCDRKNVGCVIVSEDGFILSTGYNGSITGAPHCDDVGHDIENDHCIRTIHAEANALISAARNGTKIKDACIYINTYPCWECFKLIVNANIGLIVYRAEYRKNIRITSLASELGVSIYSEDEILQREKQ